MKLSYKELLGEKINDDVREIALRRWEHQTTQRFFLNKCWQETEKLYCAG